MEGLRFVKNSSITVMILAVVTALLFALPVSTHAAGSKDLIHITEWEMKWAEHDWQTIKATDDVPEIPSETKTIWLRFQLPQVEWQRPALLLNTVSAKQISITINDELVYSVESNYESNRNKILLPLKAEEADQMVLIQLDSMNTYAKLPEQKMIGEYGAIHREYMKYDTDDFVLGITFSLTALLLTVSIIFINRTYRMIWASLITIMFAIGIMMISNAPYAPPFFESYGSLLFYGFDIGSALLLPSLFFFFEGVFGRGPYSLITKCRWVQVFYLTLSTSLLLLGIVFPGVSAWNQHYGLYLSAVYILISIIVLIGLLVLYCRKKNVDAIIITTGFSIFGVIAALEVVLSLSQNMNYRMMFWKLGIIVFMLSLVIVFARRVMHNYERVIEYSKQLEQFNDELQRAEKMQIVSQLAASIAHEVRNPLQVTRGFLQLLGGRTSYNKEQGYIKLAISELDRASEIITDFLTYARPQIENDDILNVEKEIKQIEAILLPYAVLQGGAIQTILSDDLYVRGNSSKFKQAMINIVKNSIEAFGENGRVIIRAYEDFERKQAVIHIQDNGEGMNEADLIRLGEPYYSKKSKGTGLGLMVTFRIIETMEGKLSFTSKKGVGTEAKIVFPLINKARAAVGE